MELKSCPLTDLGIPQDVMDAASKVGVSAKELVRLCVKHSVEAARDWLLGLAQKLPKT